MKIRVTELPDEGGMLSVEEEGKKILICRIAGKYHAISDICSHAKVQLSHGKLRGTAVICPLHGARFDVTSGKCLSGPAVQDVRSYQIIEEDEAVFVTSS